MQALVVGASGIVGGSIVEQLVRAGERPLALSRQTRRSPDINWIHGDLADRGAIASLEVDVLYCTAEIGLLADALTTTDLPALKRVVAFTSTSLTTKIHSEIAAERDLMQRLADGERRLASLCEQRGIAWTILRPTVIYAEGRDGNITRLARIIRRFGVLPLMGKGDGLRQPVHAEDLASGAIAAAASVAAVNKTYALPGGEIVSYREMVGRIFDALGKPRRIIALPPQLWTVVFTLAKPLLPDANVAMGRRMAEDMVFDGAAAEQDFGWRPRDFQPRFPESFAG